MSVRSDAALCRSCAAIDLASRMVRIVDAEHAYVCAECARSRGGAR